VTQILIRNGVLRQISDDFTINAWDAAVNKDNAWNTTSGGSRYSTWSEYEMSGTKNLVSVYSTTESSTQSQEFLPVFYQPSDSYAGQGDLRYPLMVFNQEAALRYNGSSNIFLGSPLGFSVTSIARISSIGYGKKAFVLSVGVSQSIGDTPLWSYADIHLFRDSSTNYNYLISRVGSSYKSTRITGAVVTTWQPEDVHIYTMTYDGSFFRISIDNNIVTSHSAISTGGLWGAYNYADSNTFWFGGDVGYLNISDTYTMYTGSVGYHSLVYTTYVADPLAGGSQWNDEIKELCQYRYKLPNPVDTSIVSTTSSTLGSAEIIVFGSYNFGGTQQFL